MNEKGGKIFLPKASNNIKSYVDEKYGKIKEEIIFNKVEYNNKAFKMKIVSKENSHLFFYITYKNKKITDTYKKDYYEGASLFKHINTDLEKNIYNLTNNKCKVNELSTLDKYTEKVKERILKEDNLLSLRFYYIEQEITLESLTTDNINSKITNIINNNINKDIHPKYYNITFTDKNDITKSILITNITEDFINNEEKNNIINDIINKKDSILLRNNHIDYKYLNEEE